MICEEEQTLRGVLASTLIRIESDWANGLWVGTITDVMVFLILAEQVVPQYFVQVDHCFLIICDYHILWFAEGSLFVWLCKLWTLLAGASRVAIECTLGALLTGWLVRVRVVSWRASFTQRCLPSINQAFWTLGAFSCSSNICIHQGHPPDPDMGIRLEGGTWRLLEIWMHWNIKNVLSRLDVFDRKKFKVFSRLLR